MGLLLSKLIGVFEIGGIGFTYLIGDNGILKMLSDYFESSVELINEFLESLGINLDIKLIGLDIIELLLEKICKYFGVCINELKIN